jgi:hypothetical protein
MKPGHNATFRVEENCLGGVGEQDEVIARPFMALWEDRPNNRLVGLENANPAIAPLTRRAQIATSREWNCL